MPKYQRQMMQASSAATLLCRNSSNSYHACTQFCIDGKLPLKLDPPVVNAAEPIQYIDNDKELQEAMSLSLDMYLTESVSRTTPSGLSNAFTYTQDERDARMIKIYKFSAESAGIPLSEIIAKEETVDQYCLEIATALLHKFVNISVTVPAKRRKIDDCGDIEFVASREMISFMDPLSMSRITHPSRGSHCVHKQCFDLQNVLISAVNFDQMICPCCNASMDDLIIDPRFMQLLKKYPNLDGCILDEAGIDQIDKGCAQNDEFEDVAD